MKKPDYRKELTVFHITCGAAAYKRSKSSIENQTCKFNFFTIENIAPMGAAFQEMINRCTTKYFVQVDEDMILLPNAIETLYFEIKKQNEKIAMVWFPLEDKHLDHVISGIKIYAHEWYKQVYFKHTLHCEIDQNKRIKNMGGEIVGNLEMPILGYHGTKYTQKEMFERCKMLAIKQKLIHELNWKKPLFKKIVDKLGLDTESLEFWELVGWISGYSQTQLPSKGRYYGTEDKNFKYFKELLK